MIYSGLLQLDWYLVEYIEVVRGDQIRVSLLCLVVFGLLSCAEVAGTSF